MAIHKQNILFFVFLVMTISASAQLYDIGAWTSWGIKKKINKKWTFNITEQIRFYQDMHRLSYLNTEVGMDYKLNEYITVSPNYRFINRHMPNGSFSQRHRLFFDLSFNHKVKKKWGFTLRTRFQTQYSDVYSSEWGFNPQNYWRNMLTIRYRLSKSLSPYVSQEYFYALNGMFKNQVTSSLSYLGMQYKYDKDIQLNFYLLYQQINYTLIPRRNFILGFSFAYSL